MRRSRTWGGRKAALAAVTATIALGALVAGSAPGQATQRTAQQGRYAHHPHPHHQRPAQRAMDAAVHGGVPGAIGRVEREGHGHHWPHGPYPRTDRPWTGTSGVADLRTGAARDPGEHFRIGSVSKTFLATVVLQLADEGRLSLDDTVHQWLPGLVMGNGNDGRKITVRQLLQHTSGLYDYLQDPDFDAVYGTERFLEHRYEGWAPEAVVGVAMQHRPEFAPGTRWKYSNTNYVLASLIVDKAAGRPYAREIERRVLQPLKLRDTRVPGTSPGLPAPHGKGYVRFTPGAEPLDVTEFNPSWARGAGDMISTTRDLDLFYDALLGGRLLSPARQADLLRTVPTGDTTSPRTGYGLGVFVYEFSCGVRVWGHGGSVHGSTTFVGTTRGMPGAEGRPRTMAFQYNVAGGGSGSAHDIAEAEFCAR